MDKDSEDSLAYLLNDINLRSHSGEIRMVGTPNKSDDIWKMFDELSSDGSGRGIMPYISTTNSASSGGFLTENDLMKAFNELSQNGRREPVNEERERLALNILQAHGKDEDAEEKAEAAIDELYKFLGLPAPKKAWYTSPYVLMETLLFTEGRKYMPDSFAFRHLTSYAMSSQRDSAVSFGKNEETLQRVAEFIERESPFTPPRNRSAWGRTTTPRNSLQDCILASLKFGAGWHASRSYTDDNDWKVVDTILRKLALSTTGFLLSAPIAYLIEAPTRIALNDHNVLDYEDGPAITWSDGKGVYALKGVSFPKDMHKKLTNHSITTKEALGLIDVDQRRVATGYLKPKDMIKAMDAILVDEGVKRSYKYYGRRIQRLEETPSKLKLKNRPDITISNKLYKTQFFTPSRQSGLSMLSSSTQRQQITINGREELIYDSLLARTPMFTPEGRPVTPRQTPPDTINWRYFLHYQDPSTGEDYISFVTQAVAERGEDADAAMSWKQHSTKEEYLSMYLEA